MKLTLQFIIFFIILFLAKIFFLTPQEPITLNRNISSSEKIDFDKMSNFEIFQLIDQRQDSQPKDLDVSDQRHNAAISVFKEMSKEQRVRFFSARSGSVVDIVSHILSSKKTNLDAAGNLKWLFTENDVWNISERSGKYESLGHKIFYTFPVNRLDTLLSGGFTLEGLNQTDLDKRLSRLDENARVKMQMILDKQSTAAAGDFREINKDNLHIEKAQQTISTELLKVKESSDAAHFCFENFLENEARAETLIFCHETFKFFSRILGLQIKSPQVTRQHGMSLGKCALQINIASDAEGRIFQDPENSGPHQDSHFFFSEKKPKDDGSFDYLKKKSQPLRTLYDFAKKSCPGYVAIYKEKGIYGEDERNWLVRRDRTHIYNITFDKFSCWEEKNPKSCILRSPIDTRLDGIPTMQSDPVNQ